MAEFNSGYVLTDAGKILQAKAEAGEALNLTRMVLGDGEADSLDAYRTLTAIIRPRHNMLIASKEQTEQACLCSATVTSHAVDSGFYARELGLYAMDGDQEVLYLVSYDVDPIYIPGKDEGLETEVTFTVQLSFSDNTVVVLKLPKDAEGIVSLVQDNALKSQDAAKAAADSETAAKNAAVRAEKNMQNAQLSAAEAKQYAAAAANSQANADWDVTDENDPRYIRNKPDISGMIGSKLSAFSAAHFQVSTTQPANMADGGVWIKPATTATDGVPRPYFARDTILVTAETLPSLIPADESQRSISAAEPETKAGVWLRLEEV